MRLIDAEKIPWDVEGVGTIPVVTKDEIDKMPTVDVEPVRHGKWITDSLERNCSGVRPYYLFCSECHHSQRKPSKYCPNCGADMRGDKQKRREYEQTK